LLVVLVSQNLTETNPGAVRDFDTGFKQRQWDTRI
jgi:hypothetical protein